MFKSMLRTALCGTVALVLAQGAVAAQADLEAKVLSLEAKISQLQQTQSDNWLNDRRAEEVKSLIQEVLNDAETRSSLLADGTQAGHDGKNFYLASADGDFLMNIWGQIQFRWTWDNQDLRPDEDDSGFTVRRAKIGFEGHAWSPKLHYRIVLAEPLDHALDVVIAYDISDKLTLSGGKFKLPFVREELTSSKRLLSVERSLVTEFFTLDRADQIQISYDDGPLGVALSYNDGAQSEHTVPGGDTVENAFTGRIDYAIQGERSQGDDYTAWHGEDTSILVGGAFHWEAGDFMNGVAADYFAWTFDASLEHQGWGLAGAITGGSIDPDAIGLPDRDMLGYLVQGSYNIDDTIEPFLRWEMIDGDSTAVTDDEFAAVTLGVNYYFQQHNAKLTADLLYAYDGSIVQNPFGDTILSSGEGATEGSTSAEVEDIFIARIQMQMLF